MIKLNCDLGESFGAWSMGLDEQVMPFIDQASLACGYHGGDPLTIEKTLALAKQHQVMVGAHPSYPDLVGFGRRSLQCSAEEIKALMHYQIAALDGMASIQQLELRYVKPHGALYNDMMQKEAVRQAIMQAVAQYHRPLTLMIQATTEHEKYLAEAKALGISLWSEAFADRSYDDDGRLLPRTKSGALLSKENMLAQVSQLKRCGTITTVSGQTLALNPDSLCVHGDNMAGVQAIADIQALLRG